MSDVQLKHVFLLFGPSHSGKSATGNILLDRKIFSENEPTKKCIAERNEASTIKVIDTKATPDYKSDQIKIKKILADNSEVSRSLLLSPIGPRNAVMVVKKDQEPEQVAGCLQFMNILLGREALE